MKRYLSYCTILSALLFASCVNVTEGISESDALSVSINKIEMGAEGGEQAVEVESYCTWKVTSTDDWTWITPSTKKGNKGKNAVKFILSENQTVENRTATIVIENAMYDLVHEIAVLQKAGDAYITPSKNSFQVTSAGLSELITVDSNVDYVISSSEEWCSISKDAGKSGQDKFNLIVNPSATTESRSAVITLSNTSKMCSVTITVTQDSFSPSLIVSDAEISSTDEGHEKDITITSNISWTATCEASWVKLSAVNGEGGTKTVSVKIDKNSDLNARSAKVLVSNEIYGITKEITITQSPIVPSLNVSATEFSVTEEAVTKEFTVDANIDWTTSCDVNWVKITPVNGQKGTSIVKIEISKNESTVQRTGTLKVESADYNIIKSIRINQLPIAPTIEVSDVAFSATPDGVSKDITITANIDWTIACAANWVDLSAANGRVGTHTVNISVRKNETTSARQTTITITNTKYGINKEIAIEQQAFAPIFELSENEINATSSGLSKNIALTSNISWVATCNANWITLSTAKGSAGNNNINITVAANDATSARAAVIQFKNTQYNITEEVVVEQDAIVPELQVSNTSFSVGCAQETRSVTVSSNIDWTASCSASWVVLTPVNGSDGTSTLSISIAANNIASERNTEVLVYSTKYNISRSISISQGAFEPVLSFYNGNELQLPFSSGEIALGVNSNVAYTVTSDANWLTVSKNAAGIQLSYETNNSMSIRTATVTITANDYPGLTSVLNVTQQMFSETHVIKFTSTGGVFLPNSASGFGANIIGFTNESGQGEIRFDGPVTSIGASAFKNCTELTSVILPSTVTSISSEAFYGCASLTDIMMPSTITSIGSYAFYGCTSLEEFVVPSGVKSVGQYTFYNCTSLSEVDLPSTVTSIGNYAFYNCSNIESISLPSALQSIGSYAFNGCSSIKGIIIPSSVTSLGNYAFRYCTSLESVTLPSGLTSIPSELFRECSSLKNVDIPSSVTSIGSNAFYKCTALDEIELPSALTTINTSAFAYCSSLETIVIPRAVTSIGTSAFYNCTKLSDVICLSKTPPTGGSSMFANNASDRKIYVPTGSSAAYSSASIWSDYSSYISDLEYTPSECVSLSITAQDVEANETTTLITYTAITNGQTPFGPLNNVEITGTVQSAAFGQNTSSKDVSRTISYTYLGKTATTVITQKYARSYEVRLNSQWRKSTSVSNPSSSTYDGVYESYSNYNKDSSTATMYIDITGYTTFTIYVRSDAESKYDYVKVYNLDSTSSVKYSTDGKQNSGTSLSSYTAVTFTNISSGKHTITISYTKDYSVNSGTDRGYVLIPKDQ